MDLSPSQVANASFKTVRKGYDPDEVDSFLKQAAAALEQAKQQSTAMEARARAAVARLQEITAADSGAAPATERGQMAAPSTTPSPPHVQPDEAETITRTLLLAQRTADTTVAEAEAEAERIRAAAEAEAEAKLESTRELAGKMLENARADAQDTFESERQSAASEVEALLARRQFLIGDVDELERFLVDQRDRLRAAARAIESVCERVPDGLGSITRPVLSAVDTDDPDASDAPSDTTGAEGPPTAELRLPPEAAGPFADAAELAANLDPADLPRVGTSDAGGPSGDDATTPRDADAEGLPSRDNATDV